MSDQMRADNLAPPPLSRQAKRQISRILAKGELRRNNKTRELRYFKVAPPPKPEAM